ncbi:MAG: hypothetical protein ACI3V4_12705 [Faecousia sp.]
MKTMHKNRRLTMLLLVALLLIPMLAMTANASPKVWYEFNFSNDNNTITGTKTDYGYAAGVSVWEGSEFNNGNVRFQLFSPYGGSFSYESNRVYGVTSSCPVYYFDWLTFNGNMKVNMEGHGYNGMISCKGNFVP